MLFQWDFVVLCFVQGQLNEREADMQKCSEAFGHQAQVLETLNSRSTLAALVGSTSSPFQSHILVCAVFGWGTQLLVSGYASS